MSEQQEQRGILRKRVGEFYVSFLAVVPFDIERIDGLHSVWLGFKRIGVEGRGIVADVELLYPLQVPEHEGRPETDRVPFFQIIVDLLSLSAKAFRRGEEVAVMMQVMNTDFETAVG